MSRSEAGAGYWQFQDVSVSCSGVPLVAPLAPSAMGTRKSTPLSFASMTPS